MNKTLLSSSLLLAGLAIAGQVRAEATGDCIALSGDHQVVRSGGGQNILLRNGDQHYRINFRDACSSVATSSKISFSTEGAGGNMLCAGSTHVLTQQDSCAIASVEPIDGSEFARRARMRR